MELLRLSDVSKRENNGFTVRHINFTQQVFEKIAIVGETGSGKTSLLKIIAGLMQPDTGEILFEQQKVRGPFDQLIPGHTGIAYLSQHFELRNNYWVHEILSYANHLQEEMAAGIYRICRIDHLLGRRTDQLSGGERQRIALARLLIGSPRLLLLDEPFSNLDPPHRKIIRSVINDVNTELGISCIMVSHDAPDILSWAETILVLKDGELVQRDSPAGIYYRPANEYSAGLFGEYNLVDNDLAGMLHPLLHHLPAGKKMLVRPEQFTISKDEKGWEGIIKSRMFMGNHYVLEILAGKQLLKINTAELSFAIGEKVYLSLQNFDPWFL